VPAHIELGEIELDDVPTAMVAAKAQYFRTKGVRFGAAPHCRASGQAAYIRDRE
jgi:hypothetical protein